MLLPGFELTGANQARRKDRLLLMENKEGYRGNVERYRGNPASPKSAEKGCYSPVLERHETLTRVVWQRV